MICGLFPGEGHIELYNLRTFHRPKWLRVLLSRSLRILSQSLLKIVRHNRLVVCFCLCPLAAVLPLSHFGKHLRPQCLTFRVIVCKERCGYQCLFDSIEVIFFSAVPDPIPIFGVASWHSGSLMIAISGRNLDSWFTMPLKR